MSFDIIELDHFYTGWFFASFCTSRTNPLTRRTAQRAWHGTCNVAVKAPEDPEAQLDAASEMCHGEISGERLFLT